MHLHGEIILPEHTELLKSQLTIQARKYLAPLHARESNPRVIHESMAFYYSIIVQIVVNRRLNPTGTVSYEDLIVYTQQAFSKKSGLSFSKNLFREACIQLKTDLDPENNRLEKLADGSANFD